MPTDITAATEASAATTGDLRASRRDAGARIAGWLLALGLALVLPAWASTIVTVLAAAAVVERLVRHRGRGLLDAALVAATSAVVAPIALGLLLNLLPVGLTRVSWTVALAVTGTIALLVAARHPLPPSPFRQWLGRIPDTGWIFAAGAIVVVVAAVGLSVRATHGVDTAPMELSASSVTDGRTVLTVSSGTPETGLKLVLKSGSTTQVVADDLVLDADQDQSFSVTVTNHSRLIVDLLDANSVVVRELIIDTTLS